MFQPHSYAIQLTLMVMSMCCWGSWANTVKLTPGWRFQSFYWDYVVGVFLASVGFGLLLGGGSEFLAGLFASSSTAIAFALLSGFIFNAANQLLVAAIDIAGLAVAFPIGIGLALVIGVVLNYILNPQGNPVLLFGGAAIVVAAIVVDAMAYRIHERNRQPVAAMAAAPEPRSAAARTGHSSPARNKGSSSAKGIVLSLIAGVLMG